MNVALSEENTTSYVLPSRSVSVSANLCVFTQRYLAELSETVSIDKRRNMWLDDPMPEHTPPPISSRYDIPMNQNSIILNPGHSEPLFQTVPQLEQHAVRYAQAQVEDQKYSQVSVSEMIEVVKKDPTVIETVLNLLGQEIKQWRLETEVSLLKMLTHGNFPGDKREAVKQRILQGITGLDTQLRAMAHFFTETQHELTQAAHSSPQTEAFLHTLRQQIAESQTELDEARRITQQQSPQS